MERPGEPHVPDLEPFDPALSPVPPMPGTDDGSGLVLLLAALAREDEWTERAAVGLASGWADAGRRVLLVDLALARPRLDGVLGVAVGEGVTDVLLFGSSIARIAQQVAGGRFLFLSVGTATARPELVASSGRWAEIVETCASQGTTVVVFLPSQLPGAEALLPRASDVVLLAELAEDRDGALARGLGPRLRAVLVPPETPTESERHAVQAGGDDHGAERTAAERSANPRENESAIVPPPAAEPPPSARPAEEGKAPARSSRPRRVSVLPEPTTSLSRSGLVAGISAAFVAVATAVGVLAWLGIIQVPGLSEWLATFR